MYYQSKNIYVQENPIVHLCHLDLQQVFDTMTEDIATIVSGCLHIGSAIAEMVGGVTCKVLSTR